MASLIAKSHYHSVSCSTCENIKTAPCGVYTAARQQSTIMSHKRYYNPEEIARIMREMDDEEEGNANFEDENDPDLEPQEIVLDDHDSESDQSLVYDNEDNLEQGINEDFDVYLGKDGETFWFNNPVALPSKTKRKNIMKVFPRPMECARDAMNEKDSFFKIITPAMIDKIVGYTNKHIHKSVIETNKYFRVKDCKLTCNVEMTALFGCLFLIATKKSRHADVSELWATDGTGMIALRAAMSYRRFLFLLRSLRFDDIETRKEREKSDKLAAIREFHEAFVNNCKRNYQLGEFVTIDAMLVPFRGRWCIQYMPNKPAKFGVKMYAMCDSKTFYTYDIEVYCGTQKDGPYKVSNKPFDIVKRMVTPLHKSNRNLTVDNYCCSYDLVQYLLANGLTSLGTMKSNKREIPSQFLTDTSRNPGTSIFGFQDDCVLVSYTTKKKKAVILLSSMHDNDHIDPKTNKPDIILDYNKTKGAVDSVDQMCSTLSTARITRRWPVVVFYRDLDIAGINAQKIFFFNKPENESKRQVFLKSLALQLMEKHLQERAKIKSLPKDLYDFLQIYRQKETEAPRPLRQGVCYLCGSHKNTKTNVKCNQCSRNVCRNHSERVVKCQTCLGEVAMECEEED